VAISLLYGDTEDQRNAALAAPDPLAVPWIAAALDRMSEVLADLVSGAATRPRETAGSQAVALTA
jgi:hypothetical protein